MKQQFVLSGALACERYLNVPLAWDLWWVVGGEERRGEGACLSRQWFSTFWQQEQIHQKPDTQRTHPQQSPKTQVLQMLKPKDKVYLSSFYFKVSMKDNLEEVQNFQVVLCLSSYPQNVQQLRKKIQILVCTVSKGVVNGSSPLPSTGTWE